MCFQHLGARFDCRRVSAIRNNFIAFVFVINRWNTLLLWSNAGSVLLGREYCPHGLRSPGWEMLSTRHIDNLAGILYLEALKLE